MYKKLILRLTQRASALVLLTSNAVAQETYVDKSPDPVDLSLEELNLHPTILGDIPLGHVIVAAAEHTGAELDMAFYRTTGEVRFSLTGENFTTIQTAPPEFQDTPNLADAFQCGVNIGIKENDVSYHTFGQPYIDETKEESNPSHRITVWHFNKQALSLGQQYLSLAGNDIHSCWNLNGTEGRAKILATMQGSVGPKYIHQ